MLEKIAIFAFAFLAAATVVSAQECGQMQDGVPESRLDSLDVRLERIEKKTSGWDKLLANLPRISGYAQLRFRETDDASTFDIRRVRLDLQGRIYRQLASYRIQVEFANKVQIVDAFVRVTPYRQFNMQMGQFKIPFTIENQVAPLALGAIDYSLVLQRLCGYSDLCGYGATGRDLGIMAYGGFVKMKDGRSLISYRVGMFNGANLNSADVNKSKDVAGSLSISPLSGLQITGSYYWGEYKASDACRYAARERYAVGARYDRGGLFAMGEYMRGRTGNYGGGTEELKSDGCYVLAGYWIREFSPVVRYEFFSRDCLHRNSSTQTNYMIGLNYKPWKYLLLQANYTRQVYRVPGSGSANVFAIMVNGIF